MEAALPIVMRWLHLSSVMVLLGGLFYARFIAGDLAPGFKPVGYVTIGAILASGLYNILSKMSYPPHYLVWFGIKMLLVLHVFAVTVLYRGKRRLLTGAVIAGAVIVAISEVLRWMSAA
jgi:hypothetical protein